MKILRVSIYEVLKNLRDYKMLLGLILLPVIMILILGTVLEGELNKDVKGKINIGYINQDTGIIGNQFDSFIKSKEIAEKFNIVTFDDVTTAQTAIDKSDIDAMISIDKNTSEAVSKSEKKSINISGKKNVELVQTIVKNYTTSVDAMNALISITGKPEQLASGSTITRVTGGTNKIPRTIDYYAILTLLQFLLAGSVFGVLITARDSGTDLHIRLHSLPVTKWTLAGGRMIGSILYLFMISLVIILFTKFAYHVNYDGNIAMILATLLIFSIFSTGFGMMIGLLVKKVSSALTAVFLAIFVFPVASGSISPNTAIPVLNAINPNYQAKVLIFGSIYGYPQSIMIQSLLYMLAFIAAVFAITTLLFRRVNYDNI